MPSTENKVFSSGCPCVQVLYLKSDFEMVARNGVLFIYPEATNITV
jgi:hypothetical protein